MVFGLLTSSYDNYRITNDAANRERFRQAPKSWLKQYVSWPARGAMMLLEILVTVLALLALYDTYMVKQWPAWLLVAVLILFFLPLLGDVVALFIIIYWAVEVGGKSELLAKLQG
jgi:hypothetical protein